MRALIHAGDTLITLDAILAWSGVPHHDRAGQPVVDDEGEPVYNRVRVHLSSGVAVEVEAPLQEFTENVVEADLKARLEDNARQEWEAGLPHEFREADDDAEQDRDAR